jgi:hypothetical protein
MKSHSLFYFVFLLILIQGACASKPKIRTLQLESVMDLKLEKEAREKEAKEKLAKEAAEAPPKKVTPSTAIELGKIIKQSSFDPPEIRFLDLPYSFKRLTQDDMARIASSTKKVLPNASVAWFSLEDDILIRASKTVLNKEATQKSREAFLEEVKEIGPEYDLFYQETRQARAQFSLDHKGKLIIATIETKYLEADAWYTELRKTYFYSPDYSLTLVMSFKDKDEKFFPELLRGLELFEERLSLHFAKGIEFQAAKPPETPNDPESTKSLS